MDRLKVPFPVRTLKGALQPNDLGTNPYASNTHVEYSVTDIYSTPSDVVPSRLKMNVGIRSIRVPRTGTRRDME